MDQHHYHSKNEYKVVNPTFKPIPTGSRNARYKPQFKMYTVVFIPWVSPNMS